MASVSLALMWHQHQPYYPDDVAGENPMPWVRLHGTKDYLGMALHLEEVPEFRCTINLVPSLLAQLEAYVDGATDTHLTASRGARRRAGPRRRALPARQLLHGLRRLDDPPPPAVSRAVHAARVVGRLRPSRRCRGSAHATSATSRSGRTWPGSTRCSSRRTPSSPSSRPRAGITPRTRSSGCSTSSATCWRRSSPCTASWPTAGQVELTTTPYYHPILPLLLDKRLAREAMPDVDLPGYRDGYPEDAEVHVRRAVESHIARFGERARGACGRARARSARR